MRDYEIIDKNRDSVTGELQSFLIIWEDGEPEMKNATPENYLLYIEELYEFINGNNAVVLKEESPEIIVSPTGEEYSYFLSVDGHAVESMPAQSEDVLQGVMDVIQDEDYSRITRIHEKIVKTQVRHGLINSLYSTFSESERRRTEIVSNGWLIDGFYLVDWSAGLYTSNDESDEDNYERQGGGVVKTDKSYEMVMLSHRGDTLEKQCVAIGGEEYTLTERELFFLSKVKWILHRTEFHSDIPFWLHIDSKNNAVPEDF
jgi:hypothetical protein